MAIIKKFAPFQNLSNFSTFVNDDNPNSDYFKITEFNETLTGGKNGFLIEGCPELKESSDVKIELLDVEGNPIYFEPGNGVPEYYEGTSKLISVHVYEDTPIGLGKITILGELKQYRDSFGALVDIPNEWKGVYNVKWEKTFNVNRNLANETTVRFYKRPAVSITELVKPIFNKSVPTVTDTGHVHGFAIQPDVDSDISTWRAGTSYLLQRTSGSWDSRVDENILTISSLNYSPRIIEVLDSTQVLVDRPYAPNNIVTNFTSGSFSVTYSDFNNQTIGETSLTGSFAKIDISQLKTFVGDVARVKVFRKSRNAVGDFQFVQESKLESSELLRDITTTSDTELSYGRFDENNLTNYWVTSSDSHPTSINSDVLSQAVKIDYDENVGGVQRLITSESISVSSDVEYTLNFRTLLSGSLDDSGKTIKAFFSSSNFTQDFTTISGSAIYRTRQNISKNILSQNTGDAKLVFEVQGSDWYISNVSLRNAQESSFSPDEFTLIQDIPRKTATETFDFRFEFYDINNNYIPVDVTAVGVFDGGNDFPTSGKLLTFESDRNAFRFSSGSVQNPTGQQIQLKITQNNLTGSILFESSAFDVDGNYLNPSDYTQYPGLLTSVNPAGGIITINNFTGSRSDNSPTPFVGSVVYTASLENLQEFETVYRLEDGDNAPQLIVTSNANQFIYEPTTLSPKPSGQSITVRAQRKNLASLVTPIEVNSGSNRPALTYTETVNGIDTYLLNATTFSASFAENNFDEVTYSFTGSDVFGNSQSDEITISKVINFDGVSLVLSNESTTFPAKSTGVIIGGLAGSKGDVQMFIGGNQITHDDVTGDGIRARNTFDIKTVTGTNVTPISTSPTTNEYGISAFQTNKDTGSLSLDIEYLAGDNATSQSFSKVVSYTKAKNSVPNVEVSVSPASQTINADSKGSGSVSPQTINVKALEGGTTRFTGFGDITYSGGLTGSISSNSITFTDTASDMTSDTETIEIDVNFTDSEGTSGTKTIEASISRVRTAQPNSNFIATPPAQTIDAKSTGVLTGTIQDVTISGFDGNTELTYNQSSTLGDGEYKITNVTGVTVSDTTPSTSTIDITSFSGDTATGTASIAFKDTEGTLGSTTVKFTLSKSKAAVPNVEVSVSPTGQTIEANSVGSGSATPQSLTVSALEGGTSRFEAIDSVSYTNGLAGSTSSNTLTFSSDASDMTSDTGTATLTVSYEDSEGTSGTKDVVATVSRVRVAQPNTNFSVTPAAQSIDADSTGTLQGSITDVRIDGFDGNTALTYNQNSTLSAGQYKITNVTGVTVSDTTPSTSTIDITSFSGDSATGTASIAFKDGEGTAGTTTIQFTLSKAKAATPVVTISANPQSQTVDSNSAFSSVGTPSAVTIIVNEGGSNYTHTTGTVTANKFKITGVTNGTNNNNGTITPDTPSDADGTTSVVTLSYTNSEGTAFTSKTITVSVGVAVQGDDGAQGAAGPGITFVGECSDLANTFTWTSDANTRQVTKVGSDYYITKDAADGVAKSTTGCPPNTTYFETMTSFASVATDVLFAQDVYANKTVNIGTSPNGTEPVIALNADAANSYENPYIGLGTTSYNSDGIFIGFDSSNPKLSLKSSTNSLLWDGTNLTVNGGGTFSGDLSAAGGSFEGSLSVGSSNDILKVDTSGNLQIGHATFSSAPFRVTKGGAVTATNITATGGTVGPLTMNGNLIYIGNGTFGDSDTQFFAGADDVEEIFSLGDKLTWDGTTLTISGNITVTNTSDFAPTNAEANTSAQNNPSSYAFGAGAGAFDLTTATAATGLNLTSQYLGYHDGSNFKSYMDSSGNFYLSGASNNPLSFTASTGVLTVTTGATIGGWTIDSNSIHTGTKGSSGAFTSAGHITIGSGGFISANGFYIDTSGNFVQNNTKSKLSDGTNTRPFGDIFDVGSSNLRIKKEAKVLDGSNEAAFSSIFSIDSSGFKFATSTRFGDTTFNTLRTSVDDGFESLDSDGLLSYSCVLPGTKIISKRGEINIEDTKEDDIIKIFNFKTKEWGWSSIDKIISNKVQGWSLIKTESGKELKCSNSHLLYHPNYRNCAIAIDELGVGGELYVTNGEKLVTDKIKSIETFDEEVEVWNYELDFVHNYISNGILSHNNVPKVATLGHRYVKNISTNISQGDLVKLDSNNELIKVSSSKDTSVVGILWEKVEIPSFESAYRNYKTNVMGVSGSELQDNYEREVSASLQDSFGNYIPTSETGSKEIWKVASIGDSVDWNVSGSYYIIDGFKMCNQGGDVVPGDLLCSSDTPGYLMKQPSEWVVTGFDGDSNPIYEERQSHCSYTVAKSMESSSWDSNGRMNGVYGYLYCG